MRKQVFYVFSLLIAIGLILTAFAGGQEMETSTFTQECWGDFKLRFEITGPVVQNAICVEDGYSTSFLLSNNDQVNVTLADNYGSLEATIGGEVRTPVDCTEFSNQTWACSGKYEFAVTIESPKELVASGGNDLLGIHYPAEIPADIQGIPMATVNNDGPVATSAINPNWDQHLSWNEELKKVVSLWKEDNYPRYLVPMSLDVCYDGVMFNQRNGSIEAIDCSPDEPTPSPMPAPILIPKEMPIL